MVGLLVDIFYLPFDYGCGGRELLQQFRWLHEHASIMRTTNASSGENAERKEWLRRMGTFQEVAHQFTLLYRLVMESPNKSLVQEIFPYIWEAQSILSILSAILCEFTCVS